MRKPSNAKQEFQSDYLSVTEARNAISQLVSQMQALSNLNGATEDLPLLDCLARILAKDVLSPINVPANDNSAMDGFAFNSKELNTDQDYLELRSAGTVYAGQSNSIKSQVGECIKIMTGAMMPGNYDTVIPQELTQSRAEGLISFARNAVRPGENRRLLGEDLKQGKAAIQCGRILKASDIGMAASLGIPKLTVYKKLKVAIISSGDELCSIGEPLEPGKIYDSNRFSLYACLSSLGFKVIDCGIVRDTPDDLRTAFSLAAQKADVIISSGGVSVGEADFTKQIMAELGEVGFWKIAMRPGRPMAFGCLKPLAPKIAPTVFFGLPGNPVAVMVTFYQFVRNALLQLNGASHPQVPLVAVQSAEAIRKKSGRTEFQRGVLFRNPEGKLMVKTTGSQGAGILRSMSEADCFIILHHDQGNIAPGDWVDIEIFDGLL